MSVLSDCSLMSHAATSSKTSVSRVIWFLLFHSVCMGKILNFILDPHTRDHTNVFAKHFLAPTSYRRVFSLFSLEGRYRKNIVFRATGFSLNTAAWLIRIEGSICNLYKTYLEKCRAFEDILHAGQIMARMLNGSEHYSLHYSLRFVCWIKVQVVFTPK